MDIHVHAYYSTYMVNIALHAMLYITLSLRTLQKFII